MPPLQRRDVRLDACGSARKHSRVVLGSLRRRFLLWRGFHKRNANSMRARCLLRRRRIGAQDLPSGRVRRQRHAAQPLVHCRMCGRRDLRCGVHIISSIRMSSIIFLHDGSTCTAFLRHRLLLRAQQHCCMQRGVRCVCGRCHVSRGRFGVRMHRRVPYRIFLSRIQQSHRLHHLRRRVDLRRWSHSKRVRHDLSLGILLSRGRSDGSLQRRHV